MNKTMLIGWLSKQPEIRVDTEGKLKCIVDIVVDREGNVPDVITLIAFGKMAEAVAEFNRGEQIGITGSIKTRLENSKSVGRVKVTEVLVESVDLSKKQENPLNDDFLPSILTYGIDD